MIRRHKTREIQIGKVKIGGDNPVAVQSMCNTDTRDAEATVAQILELEACGCEYVRVTVPDMKAAEAIREIKAEINIPLVADIHFDYKLALEAIKNGIDKVRINPGNIGSDEKVRAVVEACKERNIPIRIGVNVGSLEKNIEAKYGRTPKAMVESALHHIEILEKLDFHNIVISLKASDVNRTVEAYRMLSKQVDYPLHLGITEAGTPKSGTVKSAIGLGILLNEGIGDTLRVSLTADPTEEIRVGWDILKSLELRKRGVNFVSCPTCGRTEINLIDLANRVEAELAKIDKDITVAIMGCIVNGPGEAKEADIGIAGGKGKAVIFKKGEILKTVDEKDIYRELMSEIEKL
ncbi:4-hydroxy-3-methylbut-2-en-1-yl diphosphate synthase [Candidatus Berkelbacteria bacterium CG10_big_fil_rev_8_21_14_0_10_43_13]|uniref:4-hydroxy-3-methylbut-2-en-1-yl diphosphate synthase (flavodoxin) n=1 Tax=Candidatus Berkelbacteria bacterium CG10_big_fil_rev_8_21_14_0_10_43_13 TaxID=1974514 RepID=A0A2H0W9M0_9BACT|nr:MAG: 4-hydroxy-3-methylbut-2-en-1-yl diphosphate synthase [Candidatus Berkelbacteria bacterium CG10_big_fil_rev_8_21_14_0_10_43_13]